MFLPSLVPFSSTADEVYTLSAWNFSSTRLSDSHDVVNVPFFARLSYHRNTSSTPFPSGVSKAFGQIFLPRIFTLRPAKDTIRRYKDVLMILISSRTFFLFENVNESLSRETPSSMKLLFVS